MRNCKRTGIIHVRILTRSITNKLWSGQLGESPCFFESKYLKFIMYGCGFFFCRISKTGSFNGFLKRLPEKHNNYEFYNLLMFPKLQFENCF